MKKRKCRVCGKKRAGTSPCRDKGGGHVCPRCCAEKKNEACRSCSRFDESGGSSPRDRATSGARTARTLMEAMERHREGRLREARSLYEEVLRERPGDASVLNFLGGIGLQTGDFRYAADMFEKAAQRDPAEKTYRANLAAALNSLGANHLSSGREKKALDAFAKAASANPEYVEALNNLGCLQRRTGRTKEAAASFRKAAELKPDSPQILNNLANALDASGETEEAIGLYEKAVALAPDYARARYNLGVALASLGRTREAAEAYERCLSADRSFHEAWNNLGNIRKQQGVPTEALEAYRRAVDAKPDYAEARRNIGIVLHSQGGYEEALQSFQKAVEFDPKSAETRYCLGLSLHKLGRIEEATENYEKAVSLDPDHYKAWYSLGNACVAQEDMEAAAQAYEETVRIHGRFGAVYYNLANAYRNLGRKEDAIRYYRLELEEDPDDASSRHMLAALQGETPDAAPLDFVRDVFEEYAETFDRHLVEELEYATPSLLRKALDDAGFGGESFERVLDLGCGTGLSGAEFRGVSRWLEGVDLSPRMIRKAREKKTYDKLSSGDFFLLYENAPDPFDLIVAADVLVYIGNLAPVFSLARRLCADGGLFVFSTESRDWEDFGLDDTGRYSHAGRYVEETAAGNGFCVRLVREAPLRKERGEWVPGNVYVLKRKTPEDM